MRKTFLVAISPLALAACTASQRNDFSHLKSSFMGLKRTITLYSATGEPIRTWTCDCQVEDKGGTIRFLNEEGKAVTISGTFVVEEK